VTASPRHDRHPQLRCRIRHEVPQQRPLVIPVEHPRRLQWFRHTAPDSFRYGLTVAVMVNPNKSAKAQGYRVGAGTRPHVLTLADAGRGGSPRLAAVQQRTRSVFYAAYTGGWEPRLPALVRQYPDSYHTFDLRLSQPGPGRIQQLLTVVLTLFDCGALRPLPATTWDIRRAPAAFRHLG
jgi:hypothetical protein